MNKKFATPFLYLGTVCICLFHTLTLSAQPHAIFAPKAFTYESLMAAVEKYAPIAVFHKDEEYLPCSVEDFLKATEEYTNEEDGGKRLSLNIKDESIKKGALANARVYVNVVINTPFARNHTDIQYWFLYGYNGAGTAYLKRLVFPAEALPDEWFTFKDLGDYSMNPAGQHEGDWEHVTVRVRNGDLAVQTVYLASHGGGESKKESDVLKDGRITFYASRNGHAAYAAPDRHYPKVVKAGPIELRLLDNCSSPGQRLDARGKLVIFGASEDGKDLLKDAGITFDWMKYDGRWGRVKVGKMDISEDIPSAQPIREILSSGALGDAFREFDEEKGPGAPWKKGNWAGDEF